MSYLWYWPKGGWDVDAWKTQHPWEPIKSQQSGNPSLVPLISAAATLAGWKKEAGYWRGISDQILGQLTDVPPKEPMFEILGDDFHRGGEKPYVMRRLRYRLTDEEWGYAWLLVPGKEISSRSKKFPAIIALHQTVPSGKHEPVALEYSPPEKRYVGYGAELARDGFVVFAPDAIAFGERMAEHGNAKYRSADDFFTAHPNGSVMGKMAYDTSRAVDLLQTFPFVDGEKIGCIGHSHGGYGTLFGMLADDRIKAGVISCGVTLLRADPGPDRWWRKTALMPRLSYYEADIKQAPIEFHHWMALVAPRPLLVSVGLQDAIFPNTAPLKEAMAEVGKVYGLYGASDKLLPMLFDGPHSFPEENRQRAYKMFHETLV